MPATGDRPRTRMGIFDQAKDFAEDHADQIEDGIEKVADFVDDKTGGKFSDKIDQGAEAAKGLVGKLDGDDDKPAS